MSSPERIELMERNIAHLALLVKQLGEFELANLQKQARWEQWMQESDQRMRPRHSRRRESSRRDSATAYRPSPTVLRLHPSST